MADLLTNVGLVMSSIFDGVTDAANAIVGSPVLMLGVGVFVTYTAIRAFRSLL